MQPVALLEEANAVGLEAEGEEWLMVIPQAPRMTDQAPGVSASVSLSVEWSINCLEVF